MARLKRKEFWTLNMFIGAEVIAMTFLLWNYPLPEAVTSTASLETGVMRVLGVGSILVLWMLWLMSPYVRRRQGDADFTTEDYIGTGTVISGVFGAFLISGVFQRTFGLVGYTSYVVTLLGFVLGFLVFWSTASLLVGRRRFWARILPE